MFMVMKECFVFLIVFGQQWSAMTTRNKIYQVLATHTITCYQA